MHKELAKSARGTLLRDVPAEAKGLTILAEPDWDYYLGMKKGMLPFYDINKLPVPRDYNRRRGRVLLAARERQVPKLVLVEPGAVPQADVDRDALELDA